MTTSPFNISLEYYRPVVNIVLISDENCDRYYFHAVTYLPSNNFIPILKGQELKDGVLVVSLDFKDDSKVIDSGIPTPFVQQFFIKEEFTSKIDPDKVETKVYLDGVLIEKNKFKTVDDEPDEDMTTESCSKDDDC